MDNQAERDEEGSLSSSPWLGGCFGKAGERRASRTASVGARQQGREPGAAGVCRREAGDRGSRLRVMPAAPATPEDEQTGLVWAGNREDTCR